MANGVNWNRSEIDLLVQTIETGGDINKLAVTLGRTTLAVTAKATRIGMSVTKPRG